MNWSFYVMNIPANQVMLLVQTSDRSWNNSLGTAAQVFLLKQTIKIQVFFKRGRAYQQHNTRPTKANPKTDTNQVISGKVSILPVTTTLADCVCWILAVVGQ